MKCIERSKSFEGISPQVYRIGVTGEKAAGVDSASSSMAYFVLLFIKSSHDSWCTKEL